MTKTARAVRYDEIKGKKVAGAGFGYDSMLIAFTDGTVLALSAVESDCGAEIDFEQGRDINLLSQHWRGVAHDAELITDDEWRAASAEDDAAKIKRLESELAELKRKA